MHIRVSVRTTADLYATLMRLRRVSFAYRRCSALREIKSFPWSPWTAPYSAPCRALHTSREWFVLPSSSGQFAWTIYSHRAANHLPRKRERWGYHISFATCFAECIINHTNFSNFLILKTCFSIEFILQTWFKLINTFRKKSRFILSADINFWSLEINLRSS